MKVKNVVTISGGTGGFTLLSGLKKHPINISAIVSMADDGGSTGRLRDELGVLPPGDARQCLVALSNSTKMVRDLMNYRFEAGGLSGHAFGNIFLSALEKINESFALGIEKATKILDVKGEVIPVSECQMKLHIQLNNGKIIKGESHLDHNDDIRTAGVKNVFLNPKVSAYNKAIEKIKKANFIIIGPGDLYGSIIPNLLVKGISQAIKKSKAKVIFNCNLINKKGQTDKFSLEDYISVIERYISKNRIDFVIFSNQKFPEKLLKKYEQREGAGSVVKIKNKKHHNKYKIISASILQKNIVNKEKNYSVFEVHSFIRHDSDKLAKVLMSLIMK